MNYSIKLIINYSINLIMLIIFKTNAFSIMNKYNFKNYYQQRSFILLSGLDKSNKLIENIQTKNRDDIFTNHIFTNDINEYYNDPRIHNMGNIGIGGWVHAQLAPYATKLIDNIRYDGNDIRKMVIDIYTSYHKKKFNKNPKIIDLCCGIGISTMANQTGIDTSPQMIDKAISIRNSRNFHLRKDKKLFTKFNIGNAEHYGYDNEFDCSTIMFSLHEMPEYAHKKIIENCFRISRKNIIFVDISPNYNPSEIMIAGEPYLLDYLTNFNNLMKSFGFKYIELVPGHVTLWFYNLN